MEKVPCVVSSYLQDLKTTVPELFLKAWSGEKYHVWWKCLMIKPGSLSGRPDFLSLFSHLCNKDEETSLLFILVFLLGSIYLFPSRCRRCSPEPLQSGSCPRGVSWLGWGEALSSPRATRTENPSWPSSQCPEEIREQCRDFPGAEFLGERSKAEKVCF